MVNMLKKIYYSFIYWNTHIVNFRDDRYFAAAVQLAFMMLLLFETVISITFRIVTGKFDLPLLNERASLIYVTATIILSYVFFYMKRKKIMQEFKEFPDSQAKKIAIISVISIAAMLGFIIYVVTIMRKYDILGYY